MDEIIIIKVMMWILFVFFILMIGFFVFWRFYFLRDPDRKIPEGKNIISPADGKVIKIVDLSSVDKNGEIKIRKGLIGKIKTLVDDVDKKGYLITIMMNIQNVHIQRASVEGNVIDVKYSSGKFLNAVFGDSFENGLSNEKNEILIKNKIIGNVKVIQIAGLLARRIECFVKKGQGVEKGERIGRINLGSQVSLILPKNVDIKIQEGQRVKAGSTIVAEY